MTITRSVTPEPADNVPIEGAESETERAEADEKKKRNLEKRYKLIEELVSSEENFQAQLIVLIDYRNQLRPQVSKAELETLFPSALDVVQGISGMLLLDLKKFWSNFDNETSRLSGVLKVFGEALKTYGQYSKRYAEATILREKLEERADILKITHPKGVGHTLRQYQNVIVQRPPRVKLLVDQIVEKTPKDHVDYEALIELREIIDRSNLVIEETLRKQEDALALQKLAAEINVPDIKSNSRCVMCQGEVSVIKSGGTIQDVYMAVLDNRIIYGIYTLLAGFNVKCDMQIDNLAFSFASLPDYCDWKNIIRVNSIDHSFLMMCDTERAKRMWLRQMRLVYDRVSEEHQEAGVTTFPSAILLMPKTFSDRCLVNGCPDTSALRRGYKLHCSKCGIICGKNCVSTLQKQGGEERFQCKMCGTKVSRSHGKTIVSPRHSHLKRAALPIDILIERHDKDPVLASLPKRKKMKLSRQEESANSIIEQVFEEHGISADPHDYGLTWPNNAELVYLSGNSVLERYPRIKSYDPKAAKVLGKITVTIYNLTALQWHRPLTNLEDYEDGFANAPEIARDSAILGNLRF